jgi:hypothetical protein
MAALFALGRVARRWIEYISTREKINDKFVKSPEVAFQAATLL